MKRLLSICFVPLVLLACQNKSAKQENIMIPTPNGVPSVSKTSRGAIHVSAENNNAAKPAMNPAHGEPFHDCAVPVGAPLVANQPAANPEVKVTPELPVEQKTQPAAVDKEVRLNPPHGQPGHKCEVSVGAPLS